jgi:hypothetical protein
MWSPKSRRQCSRESRRASGSGRSFCVRRSVPTRCGRPLLRAQHEVKIIVLSIREQVDRVTIRRLPGGKAQTGRLAARSGAELRIDLEPDAEKCEGDIGALIEVEADRFLYLGEISGRQGNVLTVSIEHVVRLAAAAAVRDAWRLA